MEINGVKIFDLPIYVFNKYRKAVKSNKNTDYEMAKLKLSRNIALSIPIYQGFIHSLWSYGNLMIKTKSDSKGDRIIAIWNNKRPHDRWEFHKKNYDKLNRRLGITEGA